MWEEIGEEVVPEASTDRSRPTAREGKAKERGGIVYFPLLSKSVKIESTVVRRTHDILQAQSSEVQEPEVTE